MQYNVIVAGSRGSGKSCLIASAIVHARRLAVLDLKLARRQDRSRSRDVPPPSAKPEPSGLVLRATAGVDLWSAHECSEFDSPAQIDVLARRLWDRWLGVDFPDGLERTASAASVNVTSIASNLLGIEEFVGAARRINLIEVSNNLFETFDRSAAASRTAATHRLRHMMMAADALVICLPCTGDWSGPARHGIQTIVNAWHDLHRTEVVIALTKSDVVLVERALVNRAAIDPIEAVSLHASEQTLSGEPNRLAFVKALQSMLHVTLQMCSSYGLLRTSQTPNIDLVKPAGEAGEGAPAPPLWPTPSPYVAEIMPSAPVTLKHWMPLGAVEAIFGATPQLAPV